MGVRSLDKPEEDHHRGTTGGWRARRRGLIALVVVASLVAIAVRLLTRREELADLQRLSVAILLATVLFQLAAQLLWNGAMLLPLRHYTKRLGYWELFMLRTGGVLAGYVVPVANLAVRMTYLKRRGLAYAEFAWATALSNVLALFSGAVIAVLALGTLWMVAGAPPASILGLTAAVLVLGLVGIVVLQFLPRLTGHVWFDRWPWLSRVGAFRTAHRTTAWALALLLLRHGCSFATFGLLFQSLSRAPVEFLAGGLVYAITSPVRTLTITPGNLGVDEWLVAIVGRAMSVDLTTGLIVALVFRGVSTAAQALGVLIGGTWLALWRPRPGADSP